MYFKKKKQLHLWGQEENIKQHQTNKIPKYKIKCIEALGLCHTQKKNSISLLDSKLFISMRY
jgi:hypothetical protein